MLSEPNEWTATLSGSVVGVQVCVEEFRRVIMAELDRVQSEACEVFRSIFTGGDLSENFVSASHSCDFGVGSDVVVAFVHCGVITGFYPEMSEYRSAYWIPDNRLYEYDSWVRTRHKFRVGEFVEGAADSSRFLVSFRSLVACRAIEIIRFVPDSALLEGRRLRLTHLYGVAGTGLSRRVAQVLRDDSLLLCSGEVAREQLLQVINEEKPGFPRYRVVTIGSYLASPLIRTKHLVIHESSMAYAGELALACTGAFDGAVNGIDLVVSGVRTRIPWFVADF